LLTLCLLLKIDGKSEAIEPKIINIIIRCRSGGHNYESFSVADDVIVIDIDVSNLLEK
jgi:hypothetical protein